MLQKIILFLSLTLATSLSLAGPCDKKKNPDLSLILALDISGSVDRDEELLQMQGYRDAFMSETVQKNLLTCQCAEISVLLWAESTSQIFNFKKINTPDDIQELSQFFHDLSESEKSNRYVYALGETTGLTHALSTSGDLLLKRKGNKLSVNISSDGGLMNHAPTLLENLRTTRKSLEYNGITINTVPIVVNEQHDDAQTRRGDGLGGKHSAIAQQPSLRPPEESKLAEFYEAEVQTPYGFTHKADEYKDFPRAIQKSLERETCNLMM